VEYLLADGLSLPANSEAMPARVRPDIAERLDSGFSLSDEEGDDAVAGETRADVSAISVSNGRAGDGDRSFEALKAEFGRGGGVAGEGESDASSSADDSDDDEDDDDDDDSNGGDDSTVGIGEVRSFPVLESFMRAAIAELGGAVAPKLTWSTPKDAVWMSTTSSMRCCNPGEVVLLLKASDAVAYDLQDAYAQCSDCDSAHGDDGANTRVEEVDNRARDCDRNRDRTGARTDTTRAFGGGDDDSGGSSEDRGVGSGGGEGGNVRADAGDAGGASARRLTSGVSVTLRKWFELSPSMEFRCFVKDNNLRGICQRDVSNFYPYLLGEVHTSPYNLIYPKP